MTGRADRRVLALVPDLMDRSRLGRDIEVVRTADELASVVTAADLVVIDLSRPGALAAAGRASATGAVVVGFAPHVSDELFAEAAVAHITALPRSRFFARWPDID